WTSRTVPRTSRSPYSRARAAASVVRAVEDMAPSCRTATIRRAAISDRGRTAAGARAPGSSHALWPGSDPAAVGGEPLAGHAVVEEAERLPAARVAGGTVGRGDQGAVRDRRAEAAPVLGGLLRRRVRHDVSGPRRGDPERHGDLLLTETELLQLGRDVGARQVGGDRLALLRQLPRVQPTARQVLGKAPVRGVRLFEQLLTLLVGQVTDPQL